jgi:hypothetical protein
MNLNKVSCLSMHWHTVHGYAIDRPRVDVAVKVWQKIGNCSANPLSVEASASSSDLHVMPLICIHLSCFKRPRSWYSNMHIYAGNEGTYEIKTTVPAGAPHRCWLITVETYTYVVEIDLDGVRCTRSWKSRWWLNGNSSNTWNFWNPDESLSNHCFDLLNKHRNRQITVQPRNTSLQYFWGCTYYDLSQGPHYVPRVFNRCVIHYFSFLIGYYRG